MYSYNGSSVRSRNHTPCAREQQRPYKQTITTKNRFSNSKDKTMKMLDSAGHSGSAFHHCKENQPTNQKGCDVEC